MKKFIAIVTLAIAVAAASSIHASPVELRRATSVYCDATIWEGFNHVRLDSDMLQFCESLRSYIASSPIINEHYNGVGDNVWVSASVIITRGSLDKQIHVNISCTHCATDDELNMDIRPEPFAAEPTRSDWSKLSKDAQSVESAMEGFAIKH